MNYLIRLMNWEHYHSSADLVRLEGWPFIKIKMKTETLPQREKSIRPVVVSGLEKNCVIDIADSESHFLVCIRPSETEPLTSMSTNLASAFLYRVDTEQVNREFLEGLQDLPNGKVTPLFVNFGANGYTCYDFDFFEDKAKVKLVVQNLHARYFHP